MTNRQVVKWIVAAVLLCWGVALIASGLYRTTPAAQADEEAAEGRVSDAAARLWAGVRSGDPDGEILVHYRVTDMDVIWITVTNRWFYMPEGEQEQLRENLQLAWGRLLGQYKGPVILVDVTGRQL